MDVDFALPDSPPDHLDDPRDLLTFVDDDGSSRRSSESDGSRLSPRQHGDSAYGSSRERRRRAPPDQCIMLRLLLGEVRRYHQQQRRAACAAPGLDMRALGQQVETAWELLGGTAEDKYAAIKCRLTTLFLWDRGQQCARDLDAPPFEVLEAYHSRQRERLLSLPPGRLFHQ